MSEERCETCGLSIERNLTGWRHVPSQDVDAPDWHLAKPASSPPAVQASEDEWLTARRWIGDGMPPGSWSTDLAIFNRDDGSEYEEATFVPAQRLREVEGELRNREALLDGMRAQHESSAQNIERRLRERDQARTALTDLQEQHRELREAVERLIPAWQERAAYQDDQRGVKPRRAPGGEIRRCIGDLRIALDDPAPREDD